MDVERTSKLAVNRESLRELTATDLMLVVGGETGNGTGHGNGHGNGTGHGTGNGKGTGTAHQTGHHHHRG
jgi:hypothetical protein